jgi:hypothetical protein
MKRFTEFNFILSILRKGVNSEWLFTNVLPKLRKWYGEMDQQASSSIDSLQLVSLEAYNDLYQKLKGKYVQDITKVIYYL